MGKGDRKSKKGKISMGSFGVSRPKKKATLTTPRAQQAPKEEAKPAKPKASAKAPAKKKPKEEKEK